MSPPVGGRIQGFDVARALAFVGMVIVNFKVVMGAGEAGPVWLVRLAGALEGRAAATFVVLAGVGIALMTRRARESGDPEARRRARGTVARRALFLFVVGLLYTPLWPADILHFYGLYMAVAALLLFASARRLGWTIAAFVVAFVPLLLLLDYEAGWNWATLEYSGLWTPTGMVRNLFFNGFHPVVPWTAFLLFGLWLGGQPVRDSAWRRRAIVVSGLIAVATELASAAAVRVASTSIGGELAGALLGSEMMPPMPTYMVAAGATAMAVILLTVWLVERRPAGFWVSPLVATGQLALTLYVAHVVLGMGALEAAGRLADQTLVFALSAAAVFSVLSIGFATLWRRWFARGPLEWVMRRIAG